MTNQEIWNAVLGEMELSLSRANFTTWFKNTTVLSYNNDCVVVSVPNGFVKEWLENKFNRQIIGSLRKLLPEVRDVKFTIGTTVSAPLEKRELAQLLPERLVDEYRAATEVNSTTNLNRRYSFDSFVIGSNNEVAYAACMAVTKNLGRAYNPLFLYGGVGLGKTHLLQATGNKIMADNPNRKIAYLSSERLTTEIIEAIKNRSVEEMKNKYARLDTLIIDDIQFIASKEKTQEIIFSTFNELYGKNKQIILSSDRPPKAIPALEERLRSRFEGGMITDIVSPDFETRLAILKQKAKEKEAEISEPVLVYIATHIQKNIRELEGALNRIIAVSQIYNKNLEISEIKKLLTTYLNNPYKKTTPQLILKSVSEFFGIQLADLTKRSRKKEVVRPRQIAMYLLREETKSSFPEIGQKLGCRDHSTVIHAYEKIKHEEETEEATRQEIVLIKERIYQSVEH